VERPYDFIPSALIKEDLHVGRGMIAYDGDNVCVHYVGWVAHGRRQFASSRAHGPIDFKLGDGTVIRGWDEGIVGMRVGGRRRLTIPATLGYGSLGRGHIVPPHAALIYEIDLLEVS
jgi:peptidylprolyl isomerase/FKBP-type peptidyl-prolyl cis-trans isomerase FkpA